MLQTITKIKSIKLKLALNAYLAALLILLLTMPVYSHYFEKETDKRFRNRVLGIAKTAAMVTNADDFSLIKNRESEKTEEYYGIRKKLQDIKKANPQVLFIYTLRPTKEKNVYEFVVDADKEPYHVGDKYDVAGQEAIKKALKSPITESDYETNRWGKYLTAYAPIVNVEGQTMGIVGVDFAVSSPEEPETNGLAKANFIVVIAALVIVTYFTLRKTSRAVKPLGEITQGINSMAQGNFDLKLNVNTGDELEDMANSLNNLSESLGQLQRKLQNEYKVTEDNSKRVLNVYSDVIYAVTQGKVELIDESEAAPLSLEGVLYSELNLENNQAVEKAEVLARQMFNEKGFGTDAILKKGACVREAAINAVKHAGQGHLQLRILDNYLRAIITDPGRGMEFASLPTILFLRNNSSDQSSGCGYPAIMECADRIFLSTSEKGTILTLDFEVKKEISL